MRVLAEIMAWEEETVGNDHPSLCRAAGGHPRGNGAQLDEAKKSEQSLQTACNTLFTIPAMHWSG